MHKFDKSVDNLRLLYISCQPLEPSKNFRLTDYFIILTPVQD